MIRIITAVFIFLVVATVSILGFRGDTTRREPLILFPDMDRQAKITPQAESSFHDNRMGDRLPPMNSVPRGNALDRGMVFDEAYQADRLRDLALLTGKHEDGSWVQGFPIEINREMMFLGREKYEIFCTVCHGGAGDGNGAVRNFAAPTLAPSNLLLDLYRQQPEGEIFQTIGLGKNTMMGYADKLSPEERWAVVLYVRALQRAASASANDLPEAQRKEFGL